MERNLFLMSSSETPRSKSFLSHPIGEIKKFFKDSGVGKVTFIPHAEVIDPLEQYVAVARNFFTQEIGVALESLTEGDPQQMIENAEAVVVAGGNTYHLTNLLYEMEIMDLIRKSVEEKGVAYLGWSAGAVIAGPTLDTTNDLPIVEPPSHETLKIFPVHLNTHYLDPVEFSPEHREKFAPQIAELSAAIPGFFNHLFYRGENRIRKLREFVKVRNLPVVGLYEGAFLRVTGDKVRLGGTAGAKFFKPGAEPRLYESGAEMDFLMQEAG